MIPRMAAPPSPKQASAELERLLEWWAAHRDLRLVPLIDQLSELALPPEARELGPLDEAQWLAGAAEASLAVRALYLRSLSRDCKLRMMTPRLELIAEWAPDPRVGAALLDMVETLPWVSTSSRKMWRVLFDLLRTLEDPRSLALAERYAPNPGSNSPSVAKYFTRALDKASRGLRERSWPPLPAGALAKLEQLRTRLDALRPAPAKPSAPGSVDELLAALGRTTSEEELLVLADGLQTRGDPRGELITLQIAAQHGRATKAQLARIKAILKQHHGELLGPLAPILLKKNLLYRSGFVHRAEAKATVRDHALELAMTSPLVRRIESLRARVPVLLAPGFVGLRHARSLEGVANLPEVFNPERVLPWRSLEFEDYAGAWLGLELQYDALDHDASLPELESLRICRWQGDNEASRARACRTKIARRVAHFGLEFPERALAAVGPYLRDASSVERRTTNLSAYWGYDDFLAEVALVRESANATWTGARILLKLPHPNSRIVDWAVGAAQSLPAGLPQVRLCFQGSKRTADARAQATGILREYFEHEVTAE